MCDNIKDIIVGSRIRGEDGLDHMLAEIIGAIVSFMPLRDAAMTSRLSRQWRKSAKSIPALVYVYQFEWPPSLNYILENRMHSVLYQHHGVINKFGVQIRDDGCSSQHLKHFVPTYKTPGFTTLHEFPFDQHAISPALYSSFQNLMHLYLFKCVFNPMSFNCLQVLDLCMFLDSEIEYKHALLLARRSPCLQLLHINLNAGADVPRADFMKFLKDQETPDHTLDHIKNVRITGFSGTARQIEFVKLLLKSAAGLEEIMIRLIVAAPLTLVDLLWELPHTSPKMRMHIGREH